MEKVKVIKTEPNILSLQLGNQVIGSFFGKIDRVTPAGWVYINDLEGHALATILDGEVVEPVEVKTS